VNRLFLISGPGWTRSRQPLPRGRLDGRGGVAGLEAGDSGEDGSAAGRWTDSV